MALSPERSIFVGSVANVSLAKARNIINHENSERRIVISGYTENRSIVSVVDDIKSKVSTLTIPKEYRVSYE